MSLITSRKHWIMQQREHQLYLNSLAINGGRPYVAARLWRAPNETDVSWSGDSARGIVGRLERTALVDDAGRVANKINQYIFSESTIRDGADAAFLADCSGDGESMNSFMLRVNSSITHGRWCWVQVDRAALARDAAETLADKARCRLILWDALDVPDWCVDDSGEIRWLITRSRVYVNDDPASAATEGQIFTLYRLVDGKVFVTEEITGSASTSVACRTNVEIPGLHRIPFVLVGKPSENAWWYDGVENLQAQILNLDSMHNETLTENVYPQLVIPTSLADSLEVKLAEKDIDGKAVVSLIRELTVGRRIPILESSDDKGITRFITPSGDLKMLVDEGDRKRRLLFDTAGLAMFNRESRQAQTAESKAFDFMDTNATLGNRALLLQDTEARIVAMLKMFDPAFAAWEPRYPTSFDVVDVAALGQAAALAANQPDKTPIVRRIVAKVYVRLLKELADGIVSQQEFADALAEIDEQNFAATSAVPDPLADL